MKNQIRIILALFAIAFLLGTEARAQVYDGITQPTKFRVWLPVSVGLHDSKNVSVAPFIGYKQDIGQRFSITPVLQYNINTETFVPQIWLNANVANKFYVLSRSIYDTRADLYKHTLSATYKFPMGFMVDGKYKGKDVAQGVYYVLVKAKGADGKTYNIKRDVNLLRGFTESTTSGGGGTQ